MADSVVSAAQWIGSILIQEASVLQDVEGEVLGLVEQLELLKQYLRDADAKLEVAEVRILMDKIRKIAYDAEDAIDAYILKVGSRANGQSNRIKRFARFLYNAPKLYLVGKQLQMIQNNAKQITDQLISYGVTRTITELGEGVRSCLDERRQRHKPRIYAYDNGDGDYVVGLEKDIAKLVEIVMGEGKTQINVLCIVGMGGSGKTTLARRLYNHSYTKECFDCTAWVYVSQEWSTHHVLSEILRKVGGPKETTKLHSELSVEELVDKLHNILQKSSYLVVLDDVWKREALEEILPALPLSNNNRGSKIIITTRNQEVVQLQNHQKNLYIHKPRPLSEEEGWDLFSKIALHHCTNNTSAESFELLGKEMLKKCDGLPLAIVALAGILSTRRSITEWQQVSKAVRSRVMQGTGTHMYGRVEDLLALSYDDLPYDLKPCFLHLGVFPEDCQIPAGMLTRMWIAEGLVTSHKEMSPEDVAMLHLEELSYRFMIQVVRTNFKEEIKAVRMHDLLRDLCVKKAKQINFLQVYTPVCNRATSDEPVLPIQPRRAAIHSSLSFPTQVSHLRSLVLLTRSSISHSAYVSKVKLELGVVLQNLNLLRVLNLWGIKTDSGILPKEIGSLVHLRYLAIRATNITELPTSTGNLRNLLTFDYRNVDLDSKVPIKIPNIFWKLVHLRHLFLPMEHPWHVKTLKLGTMKKLQTLWGMKQEEQDFWLSREFPQLSTTLKKLKIVVSRPCDLEAAFSCPSLMSDGLSMFHCELRNGLTLQNVMPLSGYKYLHKLILIGKIRMKLSLLLPANLIVLELKDSMVVDADPMAALGVLAHLKLLRMSNCYMGRTFTCLPSSFPQLEELYLASLHYLQTWRIEKGAISCLKRLEIISCRKLSKFPGGLPFLSQLQQLDFFEVPKELSEKAKEYGWSQQSLRLPHNCDAILRKCDSSIDVSSIGKICEQLSAGIFLNDKKKKFWVVNQDSRFYNCFMLYAPALSLDVEWDFMDPCIDIRSSAIMDTFWAWTMMEERDGAQVKVAKLTKYTSSLHVKGQINIQDLSPDVTYMLAYIIMLTHSESIREMRVQSIVQFPEGAFHRHNRKLDDMTVNEWTQVSVGELKALPGVAGEARFSLSCRNPEVGFAIKGVIIQPKALVL